MGNRVLYGTEIGRAGFPNPQLGKRLAEKILNRGPNQFQSRGKLGSRRIALDANAAPLSLGDFSRNFRLRWLHLQFVANFNGVGGGKSLGAVRLLALGLMLAAFALAGLLKGGGFLRLVGCSQILVSKDADFKLKKLLGFIYTSVYLFL